MNDGIYLEVFCVKDGMRYNVKILRLKDVAAILTEGVVDNLMEIIDVSKGDKHEQRKTDI